MGKMASMMKEIKEENEKKVLVSGMSISGNELPATFANKTTDEIKQQLKTDDGIKQLDKENEAMPISVSTPQIQRRASSSHIKLTGMKSSSGSNTPTRLLTSSEGVKAVNQDRTNISVEEVKDTI